MAKTRWCGVLRKKKCKKNETSNSVNSQGIGPLLLRLKHPAKTPHTDGSKMNSSRVSATLSIHGNSTCNMKVVNDESHIEAEVVEAAYEGKDEHDDTNLSIKREYCGFEAEVGAADPTITRNMASDNSTDPGMYEQSERDAEDGLIQSRHANAKLEFLETQKLKRSCSSVELKGVPRKIPPLKTHSFGDLQNLAKGKVEEFITDSPISVCSADRVMLKKHSSSQVLPSRSRRLWWKLFLWSHRNLHKSQTSLTRALSKKQPSVQKGGYSSDTEPNLARESPALFVGKSTNKNNMRKMKDNYNCYNDRVSGLGTQNQWLAFSNESSSSTRVDEWVNSLKNQTQSPLVHNEEEICEEPTVFPPSPKAAGSPTKFKTRPTTHISEEVIHANHVIQSLNSSSNGAQIADMALKVIPYMSRFSNLRSINLSGNLIAVINAGSLPKGLHSLNLSKNKIVSIEGLRELIRLRILDLSYNRISRIGHGLSSCILIKELYLTGNKISNVEGLHRLSKLTVLDLSFNKIATTQGLGQLVANYNSLLALNILGNPVQINNSEEQLRKALTGLLTQLAYLNKQTIKPQRTREVVIDNAARALQWNKGVTSYSKEVKRRGFGRSLSSTTPLNTIVGGQKTNHGHGSKNINKHSMKRSSSTLASYAQ